MKSSFLFYCSCMLICFLTIYISILFACVRTNEWVSGVNVCKRICVDVNVYDCMLYTCEKLPTPRNWRQLLALLQNPERYHWQRPRENFPAKSSTTTMFPFSNHWWCCMCVCVRAFYFFVSFVWNVRQNTFRFTKTLSPAK